MCRLDRLGLHKWMNGFSRLIRWNESLKIDLSGSSEIRRLEWLNPTTGEVAECGVVNGVGRNPSRRRSLGMQFCISTNLYSP